MRTDEAEDADPNDPYITKEDIQQVSPNAFPDTYEPMLEYPGTMRPGRTPENMPYHDLPGLGINDPNPVPWPHFQEIEWHHLWDPPHEQALAMEEFIEVEGRWASVEEEAEMRMGMRRGVRERREMEEMSKLGGAGGDNQMVIMDDDEDDDSMIGLGQGVEALLKSPAASTAESSKSSKADIDEDDDEEEDDDDDGDFMLDLGLGEESPSKKKTKMKASANDDDGMEDEDDDIDLDGVLGFDDDDDEDLDEDDDGDFDDDDDDMTMDDYNSKDDGGDEVDMYDDIDDY